MSKYMDRAKELRACTSIHYNCAQSVLIPFAADAGLSEEDAFRMAANFGGGMLMGGTCGAFTGGMMALGVWGVDDKPVVQELIRTIRKIRRQINPDLTIEGVLITMVNPRTKYARETMEMLRNSYGG